MLPHSLSDKSYHNITETRLYNTCLGQFESKLIIRTNDFFKSYCIFFGLGRFCLVAEFHWGRFNTKAATLCSFNRERSPISIIILLNQNGQCCNISELLNNFQMLQCSTLWLINIEI